ncbi:MAG: glutamine--fructose-6-phosphate transaminase (isomerizing) [Halobacteria archaeon]
MCGIVGYAGRGDALPVLMGGLSNLEYRGYDSAGVALANSELDVYKKQGELSKLEETVPEETGAHLGIGHTRWSTHGEPSDVNAHPHVDCSSEIAVVHNGIIDNYHEIKVSLEEEGHGFVSETDTEVIPHLLEDAPGSSWREKIEWATGELDGSYALAVIVKGEEVMYGARSDSPLVVGLGDGANFLASDVTGFLDHTREVMFVEDGDVVELTPEDVTIYNDGERVERGSSEVEWDAEAAEKGGYSHYMLKEIHEQPQSLRQTLSGRLNVLEGEVDLEVDLPEEYLNSLEEIQIIACGTSYHAAKYAESLIEELADVRANAYLAHEYEFTGGRDPWRTLVVAVTQSGETADTLTALRKAKRRGARTLAVTNTVGSTVTREVDDTLYIRAGPEIGVAATKTFVSQVVTLMLLSVYLGRERNTLSSSYASEILENVRGLPGAVQKVLDQEEFVAETAREYGNEDSFFYIGRYLGFPVALEGALKLKEISYDYAEGFAAGELKHGSLALITEHTPVLAVLTEGTKPRDTLNNVKEVESRGGPVIGASSIEGSEKYLDIEFEVTDLGLMEPLIANIYYQLFAYHVADMKDRSIDKPRNLAKSVTVE